MQTESRLYAKAMRLGDEDFKQVIGVGKETYAAMLAVLRGAYAAKHTRRGRNASLAVEDILFMSLKYWRQYVTQKEPAFEFGVGEATAHDWIVWTEDTLVRDGAFSLPGKKALLGDNDIGVVLVDVTESPIERPKKNSAAGIPARRGATPSRRS